ncbi:hypothetical protein QJQ45_007630 [Haematococcus lacustris]|nr:hypothetical protein QJQ45_007630 [Haematococcus lacustris]
MGRRLPARDNDVWFECSNSLLLHFNPNRYIKAYSCARWLVCKKLQLEARGRDKQARDAVGAEGAVYRCVGIYVYEVTAWCRCNGLLMDPAGNPATYLHRMHIYTDIQDGQPYAPLPPADLPTPSPSQLAPAGLQAPTDIHYVPFELGGPCTKGGRQRATKREKETDANFGFNQLGVAPQPGQCNSQLHAGAHRVLPAEESSEESSMAQFALAEESSEESSMARRALAEESSEEFSMAQFALAEESSEESSMARRALAEESSEESSMAQFALAEESSEESSMARRALAEESSEESSMAQFALAEESSEESSMARRALAEESSEESSMAQFALAEESSEESSMARRALAEESSEESSMAQFALAEESSEESSMARRALAEESSEESSMAQFALAEESSEESSMAQLALAEDVITSDCEVEEEDCEIEEEDCGDDMPIGQFNLLPPIDIETARLAAARINEEAPSKETPPIAPVATATVPVPSVVTATMPVPASNVAPVPTRRSGRLSGKAAGNRAFIKAPKFADLATRSKAAASTQAKDKSQLKTSYQMFEDVPDNGTYAGQ